MTLFSINKERPKADQKWKLYRIKAGWLSEQVPLVDYVTVKYPMKLNGEFYVSNGQPCLIRKLANINKQHFKKINL